MHRFMKPYLKQHLNAFLKARQRYLCPCLSTNLCRRASLARRRWINGTKMQLQRFATCNSDSQVFSLNCVKQLQKIMVCWQKWFAHFLFIYLQNKVFHVSSPSI